MHLYEFVTSNCSVVPKESDYWLALGVDSRTECFRSKSLKTRKSSYSVFSTQILSVLVITPDTDIVRKAKMIPQAPIETGHPLYENKCWSYRLFCQEIKNFKGKTEEILSTTFIIHIFMILCKESVNFMRKTICRLRQFSVLYGKGYGTKHFHTKNIHSGNPRQPPH